MCVDERVWSSAFPGPSSGAESRLLLCSTMRQDGLWLGFLEGGVAYLQDNQIRASYAAAARARRGKGPKPSTVMPRCSLGRNAGRAEPDQRRPHSDAHQPERTAMRYGSLDDGR